MTCLGQLHAFKSCYLYHKHFILFCIQTFKLVLLIYLTLVVNTFPRSFLICTLIQPNLYFNYQKLNFFHFDYIQKVSSPYGLQLKSFLMPQNILGACFQSFTITVILNHLQQPLRRSTEMLRVLCISFSFPSTSHNFKGGMSVTGSKIFHFIQWMGELQKDVIDSEICFSVKIF